MIITGMALCMFSSAVVGFFHYMTKSDEQLTKHRNQFPTHYYRLDAALNLIFTTAILGRFFGWW